MIGRSDGVAGAGVGEITRLLERTRAGHADARDALFSLVYGELMTLATARLARNAAFTHLDAPSLVHEAFLRLATREELPGTDRRAFFAYAAGVMRSVVVDCIRERGARKRGGEAVRVTLATDDARFGFDEREFEQLEGALRALAEVDGRAHRVVELRYFGGLSIEEICEVLEVSPATVKREWQKARAFLFHALGE